MKELSIYYHYDNLSLIDSTLALLQKLGINAKADEKSEYYGGEFGHLINEKLFFIAQAYNIAKARDMDLLVLEDDAYKNLAFAKKEIEENPSLFSMVQGELEKFNLKYSQDTNIIHISELLLKHKDSIRENIKSDFSNFSACAIYSNNLNASLSDEVLRILGLKISFKDNCEFANIPNKILAYKYSSKCLENALDYGNDFIITTSSGVFNMLDLERKALLKAANRDLGDIPIMFLPQVLLLAFGIRDESALGFRYHKFSPNFL